MVKGADTLLPLSVHFLLFMNPLCTVSNFWGTHSTVFELKGSSQERPLPYYLPGGRGQLLLPSCNNGWSGTCQRRRGVPRKSGVGRGGTLRVGVEEWLAEKSEGHLAWDKKPVCVCVLR